MLSRACCKRYLSTLSSSTKLKIDAPKRQLRAFEKLLHDYPEWQRKVVLIQVSPV